MWLCSNFVSGPVIIKTTALLDFGELFFFFLKPFDFFWSEKLPVTCSAVILTENFKLLFPASVLQAMAVLVCAEMYQVKRLQHLCEVCVCAYLQSMPSRELASTGISVIRLLRRAKVRVKVRPRETNCFFFMMQRLAFFFSVPCLNL